MQTQSLQNTGVGKEECLKKIKKLLQVTKEAQEKNLVEVFYRSLSFAIYYMKELKVCDIFLNSDPKDFCALCGEEAINLVVFSEEDSQIKLCIKKE